MSPEPKCLIAVEILRYHFPEREVVYDIGGGSGAFSASMILAGKAKRATIVDYSPRQIYMAQSIAKSLEYSNKLFFCETDLREFDYKGKHCIASYVACELEENRVDIFSMITGVRSVIIVDTPELIERIYPALSEKGFTLFGKNIKFQSRSTPLNIIEGNGGQFSLLYVRSL